MALIMENNLEAEAFQFKSPFTTLIASPSGSGKTSFVVKLIKNARAMIFPHVEKIIYCYCYYQPLYEEIKHLVSFHEGLPDISKFDGTVPTLTCIDDLMNDVNVVIESLFTKGSHHLNISVIHLTQNLFQGKKENRTILLIANYIILFKNVRDQTQFSVLARQMFPNNTKYAIEAYKDATRVPYGYLVIDLKPETDDNLRLRTQILPNETQYIYVPK